MKLLMVLIAAGTLAGAAGAAVADADVEKYAHITQDKVALDLVSGRILFNGGPVDADELSDKLEKSYSVYLEVTTCGAGRIDNLFGDSPAASKVNDPSTFSAEPFLRLLEQINAAGLPHELIQISSYSLNSRTAKACDQVTLHSEGAINLNGRTMKTSELTADKFSGKPIELCYPNTSSYVDYRQLLAVFRMLGPDARIAMLFFQNRTQALVEVKAKIYQINTAGEKDMLSAPRVTTRPGNSAMLRVVENASGHKPHYRSEGDDFHQEDLANLGIRFSVTPQIIGDKIRVSGVAIITKALDHEEVFRQGGIPVYSYSSTKVVAPFSIILPPGAESVEFPVADVDGKKTFCELSAVVVDDQGMSGKGRRVRGAAAPHKR